MDNTHTNLAYWLLSEGLSWDDDARKYTLGQDLTNEEAKDIMRIVARNVDFDLENPYARKDADKLYAPYHSFLVTFSLLMMSDENELFWRDPLWSVLMPEDQTATMMLDFICFGSEAHWDW